MIKQLSELKKKSLFLVVFCKVQRFKSFLFKFIFVVITISIDNYLNVLSTSIQFIVNKLFIINMTQNIEPIVICHNTKFHIYTDIYKHKYIHIHLYVYTQSR